MGRKAARPRPIRRALRAVALSWSGARSLGFGVLRGSARAVGARGAIEPVGLGSATMRYFIVAGPEYQSVSGGPEGRCKLLLTGLQGRDLGGHLLICSGKLADGLFQRVEFARGPRQLALGSRSASARCGLRRGRRLQCDRSPIFPRRNNATPAPERRPVPPCRRQNVAKARTAGHRHCQPSRGYSSSSTSSHVQSSSSAGEGS